MPRTKAKLRQFANRADRAAKRASKQAIRFAKEHPKLVAVGTTAAALAGAHVYERRQNRKRQAKEKEQTKAESPKSVEPAEVVEPKDDPVQVKNTVIEGALNIRVTPFSNAKTEEYTPYFGKGRTLCSPTLHSDPSSFFYGPDRRYYCMPDHGVANVGHNHITKNRSGKPHPDATQWYAEEFPGAPIVTDFTRWVQMPDKWSPPEHVFVTGSPRAGQPLVRSMTFPDIIAIKAPHMGLLDFQPKVKRSLRKYKSRGGLPCAEPPNLFFPKGNTLPTGGVAEVDPGVFYCPVDDVYMDRDETFYREGHTWAEMPRGWSAVTLGVGQ